MSCDPQFRPAPRPRKHSFLSSVSPGKPGLSPEPHPSTPQPAGTSSVSTGLSGGLTASVPLQDRQPAWLSGSLTVLDACLEDSKSMSLSLHPEHRADGSPAEALS